MKRGERARGALALLPTPQRCSRRRGRVQLGGGGAGVALVTAKNASPREALAARLVSDGLAALGVRATGAVFAGRRGRGGGVQVLFASHDRRRTIDKAARSQLGEGAVRKVFKGCRHPEQAYVLSVDGDGICILGGSDQGTLYGAMTLLQLFAQDGDAMSVPRGRIEDWPDFRHRAAANWTYSEGRRHEGPGWCYDWGDGRARYLARVRGVLDRALAYKINMVFFTGEFYRNNDWAWRDKRYARAITSYARARGIKLVCGGMGRLHNVARPGRVHLRNRRGYPDGAVYQCVGYPPEGERRKGTRCRRSGLCRSNEGLNRIMAKQIRDFVRHVEPGAVYIHHEDLGSFENTEKSWRMRCGACRARWPNDALEARDGGAGGYAHAYDRLAGAVFGVKNRLSGYDAARDCLVILVGPCYTASAESDAAWEKEKTLWMNVYRQMRHKDNISFCFREQMVRQDNGRPRIEEAAGEFEAAGVKAGIWLYAHSMPRLFMAAGVMSRMWRGAEGIFYSNCGHIYNEPAALLNAEYSWNTGSSGFYDRKALALPATASRRRYWEYAGGTIRPREVFGRGGMLARVCARLYGARAAGAIKRAYLVKGEVLCYGRLTRNRLSNAGYDWEAAVRRTERVQGYVATALRRMDAKEELRPIVERFHKSLTTGALYGKIRLLYDELARVPARGRSNGARRRTLAGRIDAACAALEGYMAREFTFDWATATGGDMRHWQEMVGEMREEMALITGGRSGGDGKRKKAYRIVEGIYGVANPDV